MGVLQGDDGAQLGAELGGAGRGRALQEGDTGVAQADERVLGAAAGPRRPRRHWPRAAVVLVFHRRLARRHDIVEGHLDAEVHDPHHAVTNDDLDGLADQGQRHRVARRGEAHARQPVHLAQHRWGHAGPKRRQR